MLKWPLFWQGQNLLQSKRCLRGTVTVRVISLGQFTRWYVRPLFASHSSNNIQITLFRSSSPLPVLEGCHYRCPWYHRCEVHLFFMCANHNNVSGSEDNNNRWGDGPNKNTREACKEDCGSPGVSGFTKNKRGNETTLEIGIWLMLDVRIGRGRTRFEYIVLIGMWRVETNLFECGRSLRQFCRYNACAERNVIIIFRNKTYKGTNLKELRSKSCGGYTIRKRDCVQRTPFILTYSIFSVTLVCGWHY